MSDADTDEDVEDVRERKLEELQERTAGGGTPDEPVAVESREQYEERVTEHDVVLVDFYADWCGPCQMLAPVVEELAAETDAAVLKVDIEVLEDLAREMGVRGVPTLFVYADGAVVEEIVGVREKDELKSLVEGAA